MCPLVSHSIMHFSSSSILKSLMCPLVSHYYQLLHVLILTYEAIDQIYTGLPRFLAEFSIHLSTFSGYWNRLVPMLVIRDSCIAKFGVLSSFVLAVGKTTECFYQQGMRMKLNGDDNIFGGFIISLVAKMVTIRQNLRYKLYFDLHF